MKQTYKAKIELAESEIRDILAELFGVKPNDVALRVSEGQRGDTVSAVIIKDILPGAEDKPKLDYPPGVRVVDTGTGTGYFGDMVRSTTTKGAYNE